MDEYGIEYTRYQSDRSRLRKLIRKLYLHSAARQVSGPTLDFGCGIGELLSILPRGSAGLEYNRETVAYCQRQGLDVRWYDGFADAWSLGAVEPGRTFRSMTISHVLEHLEEPVGALRSLLNAARKLEVQQVLVIVPGPAGYRSDPTHRTFVDLPLVHTAVDGMTGWTVSRSRHFPLDIRGIGHWFTHHELQIQLKWTEHTAG